MVAGGLIATTAPGLTITTEGSAGGNMTIVAGAAYSVSPSAITITGGSGGGGFIDFVGDPISNLNTNALSSGFSGGALTLVAFGGGNAGAGTIATPAGVSLTSAGNNGANGDVVIVAGTGVSTDAIGTSANPISINTSGGIAGTGNITLSASTPATSVSVNIVSGALTGSFLGGTLQPGTINFNTLNTNGATVTIEQQSQITVSSAIAPTSNLILYSGTGITTTSNMANNSVALLTTGAISIGGNISCPGGILMVAGTDIVNANMNDAISSKNLNTDAGAITVIAGAAFTLSAQTATVTGPSGSGGNIDFATNAIAKLDSTSPVLAITNGGDISLVAFSGTASTGGQIALPAVLTVNTAAFDGQKRCIHRGSRQW